MEAALGMEDSTAVEDKVLTIWNVHRTRDSNNKALVPNSGFGGFLVLAVWAEEEFLALGLLQCQICAFGSCFVSGRW